MDYRTLDHPEVFSPGIDLPWDLSNPHPRFSLWQTLAGTIVGEIHPPGYYMVMLPWTKWFGSSIVSLRLPSVLFGVASILLIYVLARYTEDTLTALLAAAMLALNGLHLYWSQTARMYSMACFLGLLSTVLLVLIVKQATRRRSYEIFYVIFTVAGLATHVYIWPLFVSQALWVFATNLRARSLSGLLRLQIFTFIVATPLVAIAVYQRDCCAPTTLIPLDGVVQFLQFGSLFKTDPLDISTGFLNTVIQILALLVSVFLFVSGVLFKRKNWPTEHRVTEGDVKGCGAPALIITAAVGVLAALSVLAFAYVASRLVPGRGTSLVIATSLLPLALLFVDVFLCNYWERLEGLRTALAKTSLRPGSLRSLNFFLAILPVSFVARQPH